MATEYKLPFTAKEIEEKLGKVGQPISYNELNDKPFGEEVVSLGDTISWDLTLTDTKIDVGGGIYYQHVSNATPAMEDLVGGTFLHDPFGVLTITDNMLFAFNSDIYAIAQGGDPLIAVSAVENCTITFNGMNIFIPKKGIYFLYASDETGVLYAITELKKEGYNFTETRINPIDPKFLPEGGVGYETGVDKDTLVWDGVVGDRHTCVDTIDWGTHISELSYCQIYDKAPPKELMIQGTLTIGDETQDISTLNIGESDAGYTVSLLLIVFYDDFTTASGAEFKKGIYVLYDPDSPQTVSLTIPNYFNFADIHKIEPKFLPEGIGYEEQSVILPETIFDGMDDNADEVNELFAITQTLDLEVGGSYKVNWNGVEYDCIGQDLTLLSGGEMSGVFLGNKGFTNIDDDTGEPFCIVYVGFGVEEGMSGLCMYLDGSENPTVSITGGKVHKINPKYLPEGIGYEDQSVILPETTFEGIEDPMEGITTKVMFAITQTLDLEVGETYKVKWNGTEYTCVGQDIAEFTSGQINGVFLGNAGIDSSVINAVDTGEPFGIMYVGPNSGLFDDASISGMGVYTDGSEYPTVSITSGKVHKIDPKYLPEHSWNNLEDKPFGEEIISCGDTLTWDGQPTHNYIQYASMRIYQVSSSTPSKDEWIGATISVSTASEVITITEADVSDVGDSVYMVNGDIFVATSDNVVVEIDGGAYITIPNKGIYCANFSGEYVTSCHIQNYDFKKPIFKSIDPEYLPEGGFGYIEPGKEILPETILSAAGADFPGLYALPIDVELGKTYKVAVDGVSITGKARSSVNNSKKIYYVGNAALVDSDLPDTGENFVLVKYFEFYGIGDICFITHRDKKYPDTITASIKLCDHVVQIDPKYLPTGGFGYEVVKHSGGNTLKYDGMPTDVAADTYDQVEEDRTVHYGIYLVSSKTPTMDQISANGSTVGWTDIDGDQHYKQITSNDITANDDNTGYKFASTDLHFYVALEDNITIVDTQFPKKGIYLECILLNGVPWAGINSIEIPDFDFAETEVHKIDEKYLPDGTGTKIIDLTKYEADDIGNSFNSAILLLFMAGGGSIDIPDETTFWEDVNTAKPIKLKLDASALVSGATIYSDATAMVCEKNGATFFSTTFAMYDPNNDAHVRATIIFKRYVSEIGISLVLEPLTIPNNNS